MRAQLAFMFMMCVNVLAFMSQQALLDVAREENVTAPTILSTPLYIEELNAGTSTNRSLDSSGFAGLLPNSSPSISENLQAFLFPLQVFLTWLLTLPSLILAFLTAVPNFLNGMGLPNAFVWALSTIWYIASVISLVLTFLK